MILNILAAAFIVVLVSAILFLAWCESGPLGLFFASCVVALAILSVMRLAQWGGPQLSTAKSWTSVEARLPPDETPVLIRFGTGKVRIGELRWECPTYEDNFKAYRYWDDPEDDGQDWEWHAVVEWCEIPA